MENVAWRMSSTIKSHGCNNTVLSELDDLPTSRLLECLEEHQITIMGEVESR